MIARSSGLFVGALVGAFLLGAEMGCAEPDLIVRWCKERNFPNLVEMCVAEMRTQGPGLLRNLERQRQALEQRAAAERKARAELRRRINEDLELGYTHMTVRELVERNPPPDSQIAVPAHVISPYMIVDDGRRNVFSIGARNGLEARVDAYDIRSAKFAANIVLGKAPAAVRDMVVACTRRPGIDVIPCAMMIRRYVDRCTTNFYGVEKIIPCLSVEDAWEINGLLSDRDAAELKLGPLSPAAQPQNDGASHGGELPRIE